MNNWKHHLTKYQHSHPKLTLKECMIGASKTYKKKENKRKHGGNPAAIVGAVAQAVPGTINAIGDQINQGRITSHEFEKDEGKTTSKRAANFEQYYRDLMHKRFWNGESLPPNLRWPREKTNNPKFAAEQERKDQALWDYAEKQYEKFNK